MLCSVVAALLLIFMRLVQVCCPSLSDWFKYVKDMTSDTSNCTQYARPGGFESQSIPSNTWIQHYQSQCTLGGFSMDYCLM